MSDLAEVPKERQTEGVDFGASNVGSFNQWSGFSQQRRGFQDKHLDGSKQYKGLDIRGALRQIEQSPP